jgi:hypothetical protein
LLAQQCRASGGLQKLAPAEKHAQVYRRRLPGD